MDMQRKAGRRGIALLPAAIAMLCIAVCAPPAAFADEEGAPIQELTTQESMRAVENPMFRLYNPYSGEHFYTSDISEYGSVGDAGWDREGVGWRAPTSSGAEVYRLYNPYAGEHHYTVNADERDVLVAYGWDYEGVGWLSDDAQGLPIYREYNPYAFSNNHNYTASREEHDSLLALGWVDEGIAWYGLDLGVRSQEFAGVVRYAGDLGYPSSITNGAYPYVLDFDEEAEILGAGDWPDDFHLKTIPSTGIRLCDDSVDWASCENDRITVSTYGEAFKMPSGLYIEGRIDPPCYDLSIVGGQVSSYGTGYYSDTDGSVGGVGVNVYKCDGSEIIFSFGHTGANNGPVYSSERIMATLSDDQAAFSWSDNWGNAGTGTIALWGNELALTLQYTQTARANRYEWPPTAICSKKHD